MRTTLAPTVPARSAKQNSYLRPQTHGMVDAPLWLGAVPIDRQKATPQEDNDDGTSWMDRSRSSWARRSLAPNRVGAGRTRSHRRDATAFEHHRDRAAAGHVDGAIRAGTVAGDRAD